MFLTFSSSGRRPKSQCTELSTLCHAKLRRIQDDWRGLSFLQFSVPVHSISSSMSTWKWPTSFPAPDISWPTAFSVSDLQQRLSALILELGRGPGSLYDEIVNAPVDPAVHPECDWDAEVRLGEDLCLAERVFLSERKRRMKASFAELMGVPEIEVDERDLPIVAIAGSGGGRNSYHLHDPAAHTTWILRLSGDAQHPGIAFGCQKPWCA